MELFQLRSFLRVAEEGSITRAADALYITQPAVTQQIRSLERELGLPLFDRTGRGVRLTEAGLALQDYARRGIAILDECRTVISDLAAGAGGRLAIGAGVTTSIAHLPDWLRSFRSKFPAVDVLVHTGRSREIAAMVLEREIDLGIVTSPVEHPNLEARRLFDEDIVLVAPPGHPFTGRPASIGDLNDAPLILFPRETGFRTYLDRALTDASVSPTVKMETDSVEAIRSLVQVGLGLSFLPEPAVRADISSGALVRVQPAGLPPLARTTSVVYRADRYLTAAARGFLSVVANPIPGR